MMGCFGVSTCNDHQLDPISPPGDRTLVRTVSCSNLSVFILDGASKVTRTRIEVRGSSVCRPETETSPWTEVALAQPW